MKWRLYFLFLLPTMVWAQPYGNEWIQFSQEYYKISLATDGIYRLSYDDLTNAGFLDSSFDPRKIKLFHRGVEVAIYVEGQSDLVFDPVDFIEFYGQKNNGTQDEELYLNPSLQPHKYYNLFSDTSAYFLTVDLSGQNGKRMESLQPFTGAIRDDYYNEIVLKVYSDEYAKGLTVSSFTNLTQFDLGEGFTGPRITESTSPSFDINLTGLDLPVVSAPNPELEIMLVGRNGTNHNIEVFVGPGVSGLASIGNFSFSTFNTIIINQTVNWSDISPSGNMVIRINIIDDGGTQSNLSVSYAKLNYARQPDLSGAIYRSFEMKVQGGGGNVFEVVNTGLNSKVYDITNPINVARVVDTDVDPTKITVGFTDATAARKLAVASPGNAFVIKKFIPRRIDATLYNYLIISHKSLMTTAAGVPDAVRAYGGYRASAAGGGFDTLVVEINQLYDQFNYGEVSPLAIYHFVASMVNNGSPKNLLLIGKALDVSLKYHRTDPALFTYHDLVPTAGSPGSDLPFAAHLNGSSFEGALPIGRLSVSTPLEIINYLNKIIEMEATGYDDLWRKNLLHLSGGNSFNELSLFKQYVDGFKSVAEDLHLGGRVTTISKATTAAVEFINVAEEVNNGLNLITFFGHSAPNVTDIDIGFVSDPINGYNNSGRYPIILMNGCNAGNIYNDDYIFGEDWIATASKGATVVIAHTSFGFPFSLKVWSDNFYAVAYSDSVFIEKSIGEIQLEVGRRVLEFTGPNPSYIYITQIQQMGLQGDPAIKVFGSYLPDYEINLNNVEAVELGGQEITTEADSFSIVLGVRNFGAFVSDSLDVFIRRTLQGGSVIDYDTVNYAPVAYQDTLVFIIDNNITGNAGLNSFEIVLDPDGKIDEHSELNNRVFFNYFIPLAGTINLAPLDYSIQSSNTVDLVVAGGDPLASNRGYLFEFDSSFLFSSPFKKINSVSGKQIVTWSNLSILPNDSIAYYWRSKYESIGPSESDEWTNSSLSYIANSTEGWAQLEYHQMKNNLMTGLTPSEGSRTIDFVETRLPIEVTVHAANSVDFTYQDTEFIIDGLPYIFPSTFTLCANNRLNIVAFNQENAAPYAPIIGNQVEPWTCGRSPQVINSYPAGKSLSEILDAIPIGDNVLLFTTGSFDFNSLTLAELAKIENLGADGVLITAKLADEPYIMLGTKGAGGSNSIVELVADQVSSVPTDEQTLTYSVDIKGVFAVGRLTSPDIGPALSWDNVNLAVRTPDPSDNYTIDVIGRGFDGMETPLFTNMFVNEIFLNSIDANTYPYLKLALNVEDNISKTAPQLDYWLVNYVLPAEGYLTYLDNSEGGGLNLKMQEGQALTSNFGFVNISDKEFSDSLKITHSIFNQDQRTTENGEQVRPAPLPGDTTFFNIEISTRGKVGLNNLSVAVNTLIIAEQIYENNNITLNEYINVVRDATNPLLEVSFDGEYIFDGDIISPNPNIHISIRDNNPYLLKADTTGIDVFITKPCAGCTVERISLSSQEVSWSAQTTSEPFTVDYNPQNLVDGVYQLSVQVEDASGNKSGIEPYIIHFEVINKSTITNFYPYPNPFSTSVRFIFTLTGSELPDEIMIRIFTVSGRVVREITQDELGLLRIGNNATDYAWDGRDEFGDQLANGVYLYKVYIRKSGKNIDFRESAGDRGFKNGIGKLYLLR